MWHVNVTDPAGHLVDRYGYETEHDALAALARMAEDDRRWRTRLGLSLERLAASALDHDDPGEDVDPTVPTPEPPAYRFSVAHGATDDCTTCWEAGLI